MNEIKFRAWVTKNKGMYGVYGWNTTTNEIYLCSLPDSAFKDGVLHTVHSVARPLDEVILMQYTGQKDKNGVEIYEGDICEWHIPDMGRPEPDAMIRYVSVVEYRKGSFNLSGYLFPNVRLIKVLGSIHANPELLNEVE